MAPLVMGQGHFKPLKHKVRHQATLALWPLRSTKFLLPSLRKLAYFHVFDGTSIEKAMAQPSDGSGSILNHSNIRPDISQHWHYGH